MDSKRRKLTLALSAYLISGPEALARVLLTTPSQSAGPFYPTQLPLDDDNDLTMVRGQAKQAAGIISELTGKIVDINGRPVDDARIEIWQCDANGRYRHPRERGSKAIDPNFQGHGLTHTDQQGQYRFRTIRPVPYPGRTPHIHVAVFARGEDPFVTQLYIKAETRNETDFLFNRVPEDRRHLVMAEFADNEQVKNSQKAQFDIILNRTQGTPLHN
jgi:protocatechuate 3,4-dioxygenase beta subunit